MPQIQSKLTRHVKKQENMTHNKGKKLSIETDPEVTDNKTSRKKY